MLFVPFVRFVLKFSGKLLKFRDGISDMLSGGKNMSKEKLEYIGMVCFVILMVIITRLCFMIPDSFFKLW